MMKIQFLDYEQAGLNVPNVNAYPKNMRYQLQPSLIGPLPSPADHPLSPEATSADTSTFQEPASARVGLKREQRFPGLVAASLACLCAALAVSTCLADSYTNIVPVGTSY